ncbi:transcription factor IIIB 90 kDa subunit-like [Tubulanus polymorphus]|uniref:transcription factor IIIB 90 kDa subunit-like n=1 Tax=Tubulanus polymorphus TaxID=672921 RepID=UPI003DA277E3
MSSTVCSHCNSSDIDIDPARGDAVCTNCGSVLEDQIIVSEVQFAENALGGASVIGQYVPNEGAKSHSLGTGFHHGFGKESRAITLQNGKRKIQTLGGQLKLNQHCIDTAYNFFKMAVGKHLTRGRKTTHVTAACLYLVCRTEGTPHMLLDFSDILQVNVYSLGRTYLQLSRELCINIPAMDPCLYIHRFAHKLEFGEKTHEVSMVALRLVSRMKRDWIHTGRRPSGLCGAALLVAARWHGFNRTFKDLLRIVKVCEATLRKRLNEFEETPSCQLTMDEFQRIDLEEEQDPPSFTQGKRKAKLIQMGEHDEMGEVTQEISQMQKEIEKALEGPLKKSKKSKLIDSACEDSLLNEESICNDDLALSDDICQKTQPNVDELSVTTDDLIPNTSEQLAIVSESSAGQSSQNSTASSSVKFVPSVPKLIEDVLDDRDEEIRKLEQTEMDNIIKCGKPLWENVADGNSEDIGPRPSAASLGLTESIEQCMTVSNLEESCEEGGELSLEGISDDEIDRLYILSPPEVKIKTEVWMTLNADYLREQKEKQEREAKLKEEGLQKPEKKKRKTKKKPIQANTAGEAIEMMLAEKKISSKINYDVLKDLNRLSESKTVAASTVIENNSIVIPASPTPNKLSFERRFKRTSSISHDIKAENMFASPAKQIKLEPDVVVESGPIDHTKEDEGECEEDYYDEDDEHQHVSAAQLMGHTEDDIEAYEEDDYY